MLRRTRRPLTHVWLLLALAAVLVCPGIAGAGKLAQVRYWLDTPADEAFLRSHPELDIVHVKPHVHADIMAGDRDLAMLRESGARLDIVHDDVTAFYRSRISSDKSDDFGIYHNWPEAVAFMDNLNLLYSDVISAKWSLGQSHQGRDVWCFRVSDNPELDEGEPEILFDALHHAREPMSAEFCLMFAEYLGQQYYAGDPEVTHLLQNREVYFVPVVNPDGYWYNNWGDMWRKNRRNNAGSSCDGVDPNRNYDYEWIGPGSSTDPCSDIYRGPSAGSEPEIQAITSLINGHQFITRNSYHTYSNLTLYPWGYTSSPTPDDAIFVHMADEMTKYNGYTPGQPPDLLYEVNGGSIDWDYGATGEHAKIFAFTNEIGGGGDGFWPTEARRGPLFQENIWPALYLMRVADAFLDASDPVVLGGDGNGRLDPGESADLSFTLANQSVVAAAGNSAVTVKCDDPYVQLGDAYRFVGNLATLASVDFSGSPFPVNIDPACPVGRLVQFTVSTEHDGGSLDYTLSLVVGPPTVVFSDDFENGAADWTLTGNWATTTERNHSPTHSLTDSPGSNYPDESTTSATTNDAYFASDLSFWHRYDTESSYDYCFVQISGDGGPWNTLATYDGLQSSWSQVDIPLGDYAGQALQIRFQLSSDTWITEDGWHVDDVVLNGFGGSNETPPPPALDSPAPGATVTSQPMLTVNNSYDPDGPGPLTYGFRVYTDALCTNLAATVDGVAEGAGQTSWTTSSLAQGTYYWRAYAADPLAFGLLGEIRSFVVDDLSGVRPESDSLRFMVLGPTSSGSASFRLVLPGAAEVSLAIFDARGALVRNLHAGTLPAGEQVLTWDGRDGSGRQAASGVYFAQFRSDKRSLTARVVLVR